MSIDKPKFPTEVVELPSKGLLYPEDNPLSSGKVEIKYMTAREEDILTNTSYITDGTVLDKLLQSLIVSKDINYNDLSIGDKNALLISARILGYGNDYEFMWMGEQVKADLSKMNNTTSDVGLCYKNTILESGTSNMLFIKNDKVYSPLNNIYKGITYRFFKKKLGKIISKDILIKNLSEYDEILLIGSGKGVASIKNINEINWKRKSLKFYKIFSSFYKSEINKCSIYK